ncbi:uncharacterized protein [Zea mays]|uniref:Uncharacterized protein n=1 Tax=Zea mays TaxID=4577 RepID=A0A804RE45_MAIZE|nr:uncharacterized protein LOC103639519 [Zea mays]|eukprot:XP_008660483.1 uncharacterized protein LOC103639519 [Zea mays]
MAASSADPAQHHASSRPPLLLAVRHLPFPGVPRTRTFPVPGPDVLAPLARRLEELASAAAAHPLLKPLFAAHSHLSSFSQGRRRLVAARRATVLSSGELCFAAVLGDSVAGTVVASGINNFLNLYNTVLVVRLVLTWFPNTPPAIVAPLSTILAFLVLNAFTSTAAALPAELPSCSATAQHHQRTAVSPCSAPHEATLSQRKWMRRMRSQKPQGDDGDH